MKKEGIAAVMMAVGFLLLPDADLNNAQNICVLIALYGCMWAALTEIEIIKERLDEAKKRARRQKRRVRSNEYVLYETYPDGSKHRVPMGEVM